MRTVLRRLIRTGLPLAAAAAAAVVGLTAAPAHAALPSGTGWQSSWNYYLTNAVQYRMGVPGISFDGYASDNGGSGVLVAGTIRDTAADGRCGIVRIFDATGLIVEDGVCGAGNASSLPANVPYQGNLSFQLWRKVYDTQQFDMVNTMAKPSSANDPTMRQVGVGTKWSYSSATTFTYSITRPGVEVTGTGTHQANDTRSISGTVRRTTNTGCAYGSVLGSGAGTTSVCFPTVSAPLTSVTMGGSYTVQGCSTVSGALKCLDVLVTKPQ